MHFQVKACPCIVLLFCFVIVFVLFCFVLFFCLFRFFFFVLFCFVFAIILRHWLFLFNIKWKKKKKKKKKTRRHLLSVYNVWMIIVNKSLIFSVRKTNNTRLRIVQSILLVLFYRFKIIILPILRKHTSKSHWMCSDACCTQNSFTVVYDLGHASLNVPRVLS